jgi:hypothetical protein
VNVVAVVPQTVKDVLVHGEAVLLVEVGGEPLG